MSKIQLKQVKSISIEDGFNQFIKYCKVKNYSQYTIQYYKNTIHTFGLFNSLDNDIGSIDENLIDDWLIYLNEKQLSSKTVKTYVCGMRTIIYYFMKKDYIESFKISIPKGEKAEKETYTDEELKLLLKKPNLKKCGFEEYRNYVIVSYLVGTGQRANTVINVKIKDLDLNCGLVRLKVLKNRRMTTLPLTNSLVYILEEYLKYRKGNEEDYLFCTNTGEQFKRNGFYCAIKKYNLSRHVDRTSLHAFRHTFATNYLRKGGDIIRLQKLMCHQDLQSTKEYLHLTVDDLRYNLDEFNTLETIKRKSIIKMDK